MLPQLKHKNKFTTAKKLRRIEIGKNLHIIRHGKTNITPNVPMCWKELSVRKPKMESQSPTPAVKKFKTEDLNDESRRKKNIEYLLDKNMDSLKEEIKQETLDIKDERASSSSQSDENSDLMEDEIKQETFDIKDETIGEDYTSSNNQSDESSNLLEEEIKHEIFDIKDEVVEEKGASSSKHSKPQTHNSDENGSNVKQTTDNQIMKFTVSLIRGKRAPKIWRRILVPTNYTFRQFHIAIQKAMGWKSVDFDYHLHAFRVLNPTTGRMDFIAMSDDLQLYNSAKDEDATKIKDYFRTKNHKGTYEYDFGVGWEHELIFENILSADVGEKYPKCIGGAKACPPEDGVVGSDEEYDSDYFNAEECF